ncbi:MAG: hypothetical protein AB1726_00235 [Planctomycetota bacterium]
MDGLNHVVTTLFDVLLAPVELFGGYVALVVASGVFGVLALLVFKHISWQAGIKRTKDRIKGDMIAIRIYQDDLAIVGKSAGKVFLRNFVYLGLNFGPMLLLLVPFTLVAAQLVVRYAFDPVAVTVLEGQAPGDVMSGKGTTIEVAMKAGYEADAHRLTLTYPDGIVPVTPLVRNARAGVAFQEIVATKPVHGVIELTIEEKSVGGKRIVAGDEPSRSMQPERVSGFFPAWLWPAEDTFGPDCPIARVSIEYPSRPLPWFPDGPIGVALLFFVVSIAFGLIALKPLHIQI